MTIIRYYLQIVYAYFFRALRKREEEIGHIVESIQDLNTIFRDLAQMVSEQVIHSSLLIE